MRGRLVAGVVVALVAVMAVYWFVVREGTAEPRVSVPKLVASIDPGSDAVGVSGSGAIVRWLPLPEDPPLPLLPLEDLPKGGRLKGPALEQVRVLAAAPKALRPYVASSSFGESGVEVELSTGIELRFGNANRAEQKWRAAAAVLADPSIAALDYVDLQVPGRPGFGGSGHELPAAP